MMRFKKRCAFIFLPLVALGVYGCGVIVSKEQDDLAVNAATAIKENESLKNRMAALEKASAAEGARAKKETEELKAGLAEVKTGLDELRQQSAFIKGSFEDAGHDRDQTREDLKAINNALKNTGAKVAGLEASLKDASARADALKGSVEANDKKTVDAVAGLDKRLSDVEGKGQKQGAMETKKEDPEALYKKGTNAIADKDSQAAMDAFQGFLSAYPSHKLASNSQYWLGEAHYMKGDWEKAIVEFEKVIKNFPGSEKVASATLKQGLAFEKLGQKKDAAILFERVVKKYPKTKEAAIAKKRLKALKKKG